MGASPDVLGKTIRLNQRDFTIVGVAPRGFGGTMALVTPELWLPTGVYDTVSSDFAREGLPGTLADRSHHALFVVGLLRDGLEGQQADATVEAAGRRARGGLPSREQGSGLTRSPRLQGVDQFVTQQ